MKIEIPIEIEINEVWIKARISFDPSNDTYMWSQIVSAVINDYSCRSMFQRLFLDQLVQNSNHLDIEFERRLSEWLKDLSQSSLEQMLTSSDSEERERGLAIRELIQGFLNPGVPVKETPASP